MGGKSTPGMLGMAIPAVPAEANPTPKFWNRMNSFGLSDFHLAHNMDRNFMAFNGVC